jgi:hypothetical protein
LSSEILKFLKKIRSKKTSRAEILIKTAVEVISAYSILEDREFTFPERL